MILESNFRIMSRRRKVRKDTPKRIAYLENTLAQLEKYHRVCKPLKRPTVLRLIVRYESLIERIKGV